LRITVRAISGAAILSAVAVLIAMVPRAPAQDMLMPEQSAAKAKQIIQQGIEALGGTAYLNVHDITCTGRLSQFGHSGELNGFETFIDYSIPPFKDRQENLPKRNLITITNGDKGWTLDRGGVSEAAASDLAQSAANAKIDIDNIFRHRIHEKDMIFRYGGLDIVDLKEADWVELVDSDDRTIRIAFAKSSHLPIRKTVEVRNPNTRTVTQEIEYYSLYHPIDGVETPFQITRERNQIKIYQVFFDKCQYNTNVSDSLFTKESLDERWTKVGKKQKNKKPPKDKDTDTTDDKTK
jgi:hypothetical protein